MKQNPHPLAFEARVGVETLRHENPLSRAWSKGDGAQMPAVNKQST